MRHKRDANEQAAVDFVEHIYHELQKTWSAPLLYSATSNVSVSAHSSVTSRESSPSSEDHSSVDNPARPSSSSSSLDPREEKNEHTDAATHDTRSKKIHISNKKNVNNPQFTPRHVKERRLQESRRLLHQMTKGQQQLEEFRNPEALRGYARQKFIERASLVIRSCVRLQRAVPLLSLDSEDHQQPTGVAPNVIRAMVERLERVRSVASVGCGPGCDAVGVVAFLQQHSSQHVLDRILFCDWAMTDWRPGMLDPVRQLLVEEHGLVRQVDLAICDVRASLWDQPPNRSHEQQHSKGEEDATTLTSSSIGGSSEPSPDLIQLLTTTTEELSSNGSPNFSLPSSETIQHQRQLSVDLIVVSYLLSETRGKWHAFFDNLVELAPAGTLFLFSDPTAWQLHLFRERYEFFESKNDDKDRQRRMEFCWLDSSMYRPELQVLEGRLSAAVLLGMVTSSPTRVNGVSSD